MSSTVDDESAVRRRLEGERRRLDDLLERNSEFDQGETRDRAELSSVDQHPADEGTEMVEHEREVSVENQLRGELREIDGALERLETGRYGICEACGRPIGAERLDALPHARLCARDQARAEGSA
jgi:DnaK suppressor protein